MTHDRARNGAIGLHLFDGVAKDATNDCRVSEQERERMLQRVASRTLQPSEVLVAGSLRKDVLVEVVVVGKAAAQIVTAPHSFPFDPRVGSSTEHWRVGLPLRTGSRPVGRRVSAVLRDECFCGKTLGNV